MIDETIEMEPSGRVLPIFRGEYDAGRTYENPDIVLYRNSSYVAKKITVGNPPPTDALADDYWQMVAKGIIDADVSDATVALTYESEEREALQSGETTDTLLSKIKRWYSDFATVVFSGKFSDLIDAPGIVSKTEDGLVPKGDGQANKVLKTDANGNPEWREDANTQSVTSVNNKTGVVTLTAADVKAIPTSDKIDKLNNIGQITRLGYWAISVIDNTYAASIGVDNNTGDFHALVLSYNGNGTNSFNFGTIILSSPRLGAYHYVIQVWEGTAHAERMLNFADVTNSTAVNITGKKALDAIEKNPSVAGTLANQLSQVNSNFNNYLPAYFEYVESVEGIGNSLDIPRAAKELYIIGNTPYYSIPMLLTAGQLTMYEAILGGGNHYIRFSVNRNGSGKIVITDAMQDGSTSNNARIALWYR